jgi:hypothetical protein
VSAGTVSINGEILPFTGGTLQTKIRIMETKSSITAGAETDGEAYIRRWVEVGTTLDPDTMFTWSNFKHVSSLKFLSDNYATKGELEIVKDMVMPKGAIIMWGGSLETLPTGVVLCNGNNNISINSVKIPD